MNVCTHTWQLSFLQESRHDKLLTNHSATHMIKNTAAPNNYKICYYIKNNCQLFTFLVFKIQFRLSCKTSPEVTLVLCCFSVLSPTACPRAVAWGALGRDRCPEDGVTEEHWAITLCSCSCTTAPPATALATWD